MPDVTIHLSDEEAAELLRHWGDVDEANHAISGVVSVRAASALPQPLPWKTVDGIEMCTVGDRHAVHVYDDKNPYCVWRDGDNVHGWRERQHAEAFLRGGDL